VSEASKVSISIPMVPPSVNHYVTHGGGFHRKSAEAKAWERDWPIFSQRKFVQGSRFAVTLEIWLAPKDKGDVDNFSKCPLDCIAKSGMLIDAKGLPLTDATIIALHVFLYKTEADRREGPKTVVTIEALHV
jgi:Holliday junction resolvase RusA-like endonuclease